MTSWNFVGMFHRQIRGLRTLQDLVDLDSGAPPRVLNIRTVAHEIAVHREVLPAGEVGIRCLTVNSAITFR